MNQTRHDRCAVALEPALLHAELETAISGLVSRAERRLADGTYGRCTTCAGSIEPSRLRALPWAELCMRCQDDADERQRSHHEDERQRSQSER